MSFVGVVYKITNLINGKIYIGITTKTIERRFSQHKRNSRSLVSKAIKKYKSENFSISILLYCNSKEELEHRERFCIRLFNCISPYGYNLTDGGEIKKLYSLETRQKLSKAKKGKKCLAQSLAMKGKRVSYRMREQKALIAGNKPFLVLEKITNNLIGKFISQGICAEELNLSRAHISKCLKGVRKTHKGYIFKYEVNYE